jgi:hypothetical protein
MLKLIMIKKIIKTNNMKMYKFLGASVFVAVLLLVSVQVISSNVVSAAVTANPNASVPGEEEADNSAEIERVKKAFKNLQNVTSPDIKVPTVLELGIDYSRLESRSFAVYDEGEGGFVHSLFRENRLRPESRVNFRNLNNAAQSLSNITDNKSTTYSEFNLPAEGSGRVTIEGNSQTPVRTNSLVISLDRNVSLPSSISISYRDSSGIMQKSASDIKPTSTTINFPEVKSDRFVIDFTYEQPLRITEMFFRDLDAATPDAFGLRFLAKPEGSYVVYMNPDRNVSLSLGEVPSLGGNDDIRNIPGGVIEINPLYTPADYDGDGVIDIVDNCVSVSNSDQTDIDSNGRGDACDDFDRDGRLNHVDNCVDVANRTQADTDGDGIGDKCDDEESRITEKYPILVWGGIIFAILIFVALFFVSIRSMREEQAKAAAENSPENTDKQTGSE